jgi:hypothetical protein
MDFNQVIDTCLNFAIAQGGTIATYPVGYRKLEVHSRTSRTEIAVEQVNPGVWQVDKKQDAAGDSTSEMAQAMTKESLQEHLLRLWD